MPLPWLTDTQVSFDEDTLCYHDSQPPSTPKLANRHTAETGSDRDVDKHVINGTRNAEPTRDAAHDIGRKPSYNVGRDARAKPMESKVDQKPKQDDDCMDILIR